MRSLLPLLALFPSVAIAVPATIGHQGRLLDDTGAPLTGEHSLTLSLYDAASDGAAIWSGTVTTAFTNGYYAVALGDDPSNPIDPATLGDAALYLGIAVDGGAELPHRPAIHAVPFALRADTAKNVSGGVVDASELRIGGQTVIDADGVAWGEIKEVPADLADGDDDALSGVSCEAGEVPTYDGTAWICADPLAEGIPAALITGTLDIAQIPVGNDAGKVAAGDHGHDAAAITSGTLDIGRIPVGNGSGQVAAGDHGHDAAGIVSGKLDSARLNVGTGATDVAAGDHKHAAADLTSGTLAVARLPVGTTSSTVAAGDHKHSAADLTSGTLDAARLPGSITATVKLTDPNASCTSSTTALHGTLRYRNGFFEACTTGGWVVFAREPARGSSQSDPGVTCKTLLDDNPGSTSGLYWLDPDGSGSVPAYQTFCDMTTDGGGWTLASYAFTASTSTSSSNANHRSLKCGGGTWSPGARGQAAAAVNAIELAKKSSEMAISMNLSGAAVTSGGLNAYDYAYKWGIPDPSKVTFVSHAYAGGFWGNGDNQTGACVAVTVRGIHGTTWTATRYTLANSLGTSWTDTYPTGYGLANTTNCLNHDGAPFVTSFHSGHGWGGTHGTHINECDVTHGSIHYAHRGHYSHDGVNRTGSNAIWFR